MWANPHDFIELPIHVIGNLFAEIAPRYERGMSLRQIADELEIPKTTVRSALLKGGVSLREKLADSSKKTWRNSGKRNVKPPFGFCYFEGRVVRHPKEYPVLHQIYRRWKSGQNPNSIATWLNGNGQPSPMGKRWSWNSVLNVVNRFKTGKIIFQKGKYDLR